MTAEFNAAQIVQDIVEFLKPKLMPINASVDLFDAEALKRVVTTANVFVRYSGLTIIDESTLNGLRVASASFEIAVRVADIRTQQTTLPICDLIREVLEGYGPSSSFLDALTFQSESPDNSQIADGIWIFVQQWTGMVYF